MNISELSVKRPSLIVVIFITLTFLGVIGVRSINYELLPKFAAPVFIVTTPYPGASPSEVENGVTKKLEEVLSGITNVDIIRSISQEGFSLIIVSLKTDADIEYSTNEAIRKIQALKSELPALSKDPSVSQISTSDMPVLVLGMRSAMQDYQLYEIYKLRIEPRLLRIDGVAEISLIGSRPREIQIFANHKKLEKYKVSILEVVNAVEQSNLEFPSGSIADVDGETSLRIYSRIEDPQEFGDVIVSVKPDGSKVFLKDIADIADASSEPVSIFRVNGVDAVGIEIRKKQDANSVEISQAIQQELKNLESEFGDIDLKFSIQQDGAKIIKDAADGVLRDLFYAIVLVSFIMIFFLHSIRNALIVMITVPLSLIATLIGFSIFDYSFNLMTLLALSLIIGTLVDDAIVVLENIYRHMEMGKSRLKATLDGVKEVNLTVVSTSMVLLVVFLPVAISESIISPIIRPFSMVIVIAVIVSTFSALTLVPLLSSKFAKREFLTNYGKYWSFIITSFERGIEIFSNGIIKMLQWAIRRIALSLTIITLLFLSSLALLAGGFIGSEFVSMGDVGEGIINLEFPKNYTLKQNNLLTKEIESYISKKSEVEQIFTSVGRSSSLLAVESERDKTEISVKLIDKNSREISASRFFKDLENELNSTFTDVKVRSGIVSLMGGADENPIQIVVRGADKELLMQFAEELRRDISMIPGASNTKLSIEGGSEELVVKFNREQMARFNVNPLIAASSLYTYFAGNRDNKFTSGDMQYDILIRADSFDRSSYENVKGVTVINNFGEPVKLEQIALIEPSFSSTRLERYARISSVMIESQVLGRTVGAVGDDIKAMIESKEFPNGIDFLYEGDLKYQDDAFGSLGTALLAAIVLVYLIMVALYQSYLHPFVVLFSIPLSIIGALYALAMAGDTLSIFTILGMIILVGLVTKNAILVVDFINTLRSKGSSLIVAVNSAVKLRIRPILMTAISTVVGMLPIALSNAPGSEWKNGLGWALIGGITSSMLLSLIVVPLIYIVFDNFKNRIIKTKNNE